METNIEQKEIDRDMILKEMRELEDNVRTKIGKEGEQRTIGDEELIASAVKYRNLAESLKENFSVSPTFDRMYDGEDEYNKKQKGPDTFQIKGQDEFQSKILHLNDEGQWASSSSSRSWLKHYDIVIKSDNGKDPEVVRVGFDHDGVFYFNGNLNYTSQTT